MRPPRAARRLFLALSPVLFLAPGGCDRPPASVSTPGATAAPGAATEPAHPGAGDPHGSAPGAPAAPLQALQPPYRGLVRLTGDLAAAGDPAVVFVQVKPRGQPMPLLARKYELSDPDLPAAADGERAFPFELTHENTMTGQPLSAPLVGELDIEALFDPTGGLTDKSVQVRQRQPLAEGIELVVRR